MTDKYNGPAFPVAELQQYPGSGIAVQHFGLTLRDYFAAKAMQALISRGMEDYTKRASQGVPIIAGYAYEYADAMLRERLA